MKAQIIKKLKKFISSQPFTEECQVVYFFAEVRKVIDLEEPVSQHNIKIYCAWVLHSELSQGTAKHFSREFGALIENESSINKIKRKILESKKEFFKLNELRGELIQFLHTHGLPTQIIDDSNSWKNFRGLTLKVIEECSVVFHGTKIKTLSVEKTATGYSYKFHLRNKINNIKSIFIKLKRI